MRSPFITDPGIARRDYGLVELMTAIYALGMPGGRVHAGIRLKSEIGRHSRTCVDPLPCEGRIPTGSRNFTAEG